MWQTVNNYSSACLQLLPADPADVCCRADWVSGSWVMWVSSPMGQMGQYTGPQLQRLPVWLFIGLIAHGLSTTHDINIGSRRVNYAVIPGRILLMRCIITQVNQRPRVRQAVGYNSFACVT